MFIDGMTSGMKIFVHENLLHEIYANKNKANYVVHAEILNFRFSTGGALCH